MSTDDTVINDVERMLVVASNQIREIYDVSSDYQESNKSKLVELVQKFDHSLQEISVYCEGVSSQAKKDLVIPKQVIQDIDNGHKPDSYGKECVDSFKKSHQLERVRSEGLQKLFTCLCAEINETFPQDLASNIITEATLDY
ncbi:hypothetical protein EIN_018980 [Entamoeba invadens IP1]|uniref:hypothetical protein n=1 Tax=Entamoeba invadens IP1 TaxID=370355 RepID=UPI0002C3E008|nr:hypothetical protein EIN_018980 [Entamoeba invadens IP1]ELP90529.1 hypothetical protein EIN_018980 [Entamoeba invadens IP1]|eukprot:XP_004257300.1 hypothetical protein EIN_018980 [Entamoeba invadens IP1]